MRLNSIRTWQTLSWFIAAASPLCITALAAAQPGGAKSTTAQPAASQFKSAEDRVRIEPYKGPPIFLDEKKVVVPPSLVGREPLIDKFSDGTTRVERMIAKFSDDHFDSDGYYREYHPGGKKFIEGQFREGRREGDWTYSFDDGQINRMVHYKNGQLDGEWEIFRADGTLSGKQSFANGLRDGTWMVYDDTGKQPLREEHYAKGKIDGVWKSWYASGKQQQQASFKLGQRDGVTSTWNDDGTKASESNWVNGKLDGAATIWRGKTKITQQYKNGLLVSEKKE